MRVLFSRMSITLTWEDDYIDHVQELYHSETGNLQHTEAVFCIYPHYEVSGVFNHIREIYTLYSKYSGNKGEHLSAINQNHFVIHQLMGDKLVKYHRWKHSTHHLGIYFQDRRIFYVKKYFF